MKAVVFDEYGQPDVLSVREVATPVLKTDEILIRNHASSVNFGDLLVRNLKYTPRSRFYMPSLFYWIARLMFGWSKPRNNILGSEFAGQVEATGEQVSAFKTGDRVYGYTGPFMGTYAEFVRIREKGSIATMPADLGYEEAAVMPYGIVVASSVLKKMPIERGANVLVLGASGGIGSAIVQLLKFQVGAQVTGVCAASKTDYVKALGADHTFDYTSCDFTQIEQRFDVVIDILGKSSFRACRQVLKNDGKCILVSFKARRLLQMWWSRLIGGPQLYCVMGTESPEYLQQWNTLREQNKIHRPVSRIFSYTEAVEAHRYTESGHSTGSIVLTFSDSPDTPDTGSTPI